jgi:hypothetical protein
MNVFLWCAVKLNNIAQPIPMVVYLAIVDSMGDLLVGVVFTPVCSLMMKIIVCPPKEKFNKRYEEGPMDSKSI